MITRPSPTPTPPELTRAPECAALSILEHALYGAGFALIAANPRVADPDELRGLDRREILAEAIVKQSDALQSALRRYRDAVAAWPRLPGVDDDPF